MLGKRIKVSPTELGYLMVHLASLHAESLEKANVLPQGVSEAVFCELLRAYFCFGSLWLGEYIRDDASLSLYGGSMLEELRNYPNSENNKLGSLVRDTFADELAIDDAVACYVRGAPSDIDRAAIQDNRKLLGLSEDNPLHFLVGKIHIRTMRIANVGSRTPQFMLAWVKTAPVVIDTAGACFSEVVPVFAK
jgi:hypothetical protein